MSLYSCFIRKSARHSIGAAGAGGGGLLLQAAADVGAGAMLFIESIIRASSCRCPWHLLLGLTRTAC
jgi:hypothetical protein